MIKRKHITAYAARMPKLVVPLACLLALAVTVLAISHTHAFVLATTHQPERFSELYFVNPGALPSSAAPGQQLPVVFTVHNLEGRAFTYTYSIDFTDADGTTSLVRQQIAIADGQTKTITQKVVVPAGSGRGEVGVALINKDMAIHFWLERK